MLFHLPQSPYQVGGSLPSTASTYVERQADQALLHSLLTGQSARENDGAATAGGRSKLSH